MGDLWVLIIGVALIGVALISRGLEHSPVTMPVICLLAGFAVFQFGMIPPEVTKHVLEVIAEITLSVVLFVSASRRNARKAGAAAGWSFRMLLIGLPLAIGIGTVAGLVLFPNFGIWQAALLAALLAPTDAALGRSVFENPKIPEKLRQTLRVESGMNDGLALPFIIFFACAAVGFGHELNQESWLWFAFKQVGFGVGLGAAVGTGGGWLSHRSIVHGWANEENTAIVGLMLVGMTYFAADMIGGNSLVSVFVCGIFFGQQARDCAARTQKFLETDGELLMMVSFLFIGAIMLPQALLAVSWPIVFVVLLSLFVVRPFAVYVSLIGTEATQRERLFLGWFGPRGLATALFTLILLREFTEGLPSQVLMASAGLAVALSAVLHGASAHYVARNYAKSEQD